MSLVVFITTQFFSGTLFPSPERTFISNRTVMVIRIRLTLSRGTVLSRHARQSFNLLLDAISQLTRESERRTNEDMDRATIFDNIYLVEHLTGIHFSSNDHHR